MPWLVNGIGTWYWGKSNLHKEVGICEFCQNLSELRSYDTTLCFVIALIPIIPLGRKRVLSQCKRCDRHRVLKRKEWYKQKEEGIANALKAFQQNPSEETLQNTLGLLMSYQDKEAFVDLATPLFQRPNTQSETFLLLGLGYEKFCELGKAEEAYQRALKLDPKQETRNYLARVLLLQKRPDEAKPLLTPILEQKLIDSIGFLFLLVEGFQAEGRHEEALDLLTQCEKVFELESQPSLLAELNKYKKLATKNLTGHKKIKAPNLIPLKAANSTLQLWKNRMLKLFVLSIFLLIFLGFAFESQNIGNAREIYLVNGLNLPYEVEIQGKKFLLEANSAKKIKIPEGTYPIKVLSNQVKIPEQTLQLETSFWLRPFLSHTYILNPDQTALLVYETREYFKNLKANRNYVPPPYEILSGSLLYDLKGINYPFTPFPAQTQISGSKESRKGISLFPTVDAQQRLEILQTKLGKEKCRAYLEKQIEYNPKQKENLIALSNFLTPEEMIVFLEKKLTTRPVLVDWHLLYQSFVVIHRSGQNLEKEYREQVEKEKEDGDLLYLLGKVVPTDQEAYILYQKATETTTKSSEAFDEIAYRALSNGNFGEALFLAQQGMVLGNSSFNGFILNECLWALKQWSPLLKFIQEKKIQDPLDGEWVVEEISVYKQMKRQKDADKTAVSFCVQFAKHADPTTVASWKQYFQAVMAYQDQDFKTFTQILHRMESQNLRFQAFLTEGKIAEALKIYQEMSPQDPFELLIIYIAASLHQDTTNAQEALNLAITLWSESSRPFERKLANLLQSEQIPNTSEILEQILSPNQKLPLCIALGLKFPEQKAAYWEFAKKLNYRPTYPFFLYQKVFESF